MPTRRDLLTLPALAALGALPALPARAAVPVRLGQATTSLSFLPLWAARALDGFAARGVDLTWAAIPGGDPAALAALDAGDLDLAATGGETALRAIAKGQPFSIVYTLMSRISLELVAGPGVGAQPSDPLPARLAAMRGITVGVSALGGTQDRAVRSLAARGGLGPNDLTVALVGGPPALQAALENKRIDAFMLSPPEGEIARAGGYGRALISMAADFPDLPQIPYLCLVAKRPFENPDRIRATALALQDAASRLREAPDATAAAISAKFFSRMAPEVVRAAVATLARDVTDGTVTGESVAALARAASEGAAPIGDPGPEAWTNRFVSPS